ANEEARFSAVVVLPTPPFWFATAMTFPMRTTSGTTSVGCGYAPGVAVGSVSTPKDTQGKNMLRFGSTGGITPTFIVGAFVHASFRHVCSFFPDAVRAHPLQ